MAAKIRNGGVRDLEFGGRNESASLWGLIELPLLQFIPIDRDFVDISVFYLTLYFFSQMTRICTEKGSVATVYLIDRDFVDISVFYLTTLFFLTDAPLPAGRQGSTQKKIRERPYDL